MTRRRLPRRAAAAAALAVLAALQCAPTATAKRMAVPQDLQEGLQRALSAPDMTARVHLPTDAIDRVGDQRVRRDVATVVEGNGNIEYKMVGGTAGFLPLVPQNIRLNQAREYVRAGSRVAVQAIDFDKERLEIKLIGAGASRSSLIRLRFSKGWETRVTTDDVMRQLSVVLTLGQSYEESKRIEREYGLLLDRLEAASQAHRVADLPPSEQVERAEDLRAVLAELVANRDQCSRLAGEACEGAEDARSMLALVEREIEGLARAREEALLAGVRDRVDGAERARDRAVDELRTWIRDDSASPAEGERLVAQCRGLIDDFEREASRLARYDAELFAQQRESAAEASALVQEASQLVGRRRALIAESERREALLGAHAEATRLRERLQRGAQAGSLAERADALDRWDDLVDGRLSMIREMRSLGDPVPLDAEEVSAEREIIADLRAEIGAERRSAAERERLQQYESLVAGTAQLRQEALTASRDESLESREAKARAWKDGLDERAAALAVMRSIGQQPPATLGAELDAERQELAGFESELLKERNASLIAALDETAVELEEAYLAGRKSYLLAFATDRQGQQAAEFAEALLAYLANRKDAASLGSARASGTVADLRQEARQLEENNSGLSLRY